MVILAVRRGGCLFSHCCIASVGLRVACRGNRQRYFSPDEPTVRGFCPARCHPFGNHYAPATITFLRPAQGRSHWKDHAVISEYPAS